MSGKIAEQFDSVTYRAKSYVSAAMCMMAVPICAGLFLIQESFYLSVALLFLYDLLCLGYYAPVMSMV